MLQPADPRDTTFDPHAESAVRHRAVLAQIDVPVESFLGQIMLFDPLQQQFRIVDALPTADDLSVALRRQHVDSQHHLRPLGSGSK